MKKLFQKLDENQQVLFVTAVFLFLGALVFIPFCFFYNTNLLYGWLLGSVISLVTYALLIKQINGMTAGDERVRLRAAGLYFVRLGLYAIGLGIAGYLYYIGHPVINLFTVFAAYMPVRIVVMIYKKKWKTKP